MFTRRRNLDRRRLYTREFLESLVQRFDEAGFDEIRVVLPHNYPSVQLERSTENVSEFLQRDRNYAAIILKANSTSRNELMKILFINNNAKAVFADDTFPSAESEPSGVFFESPDPARAYAVFEYFFDYLSRPRTARFAFHAAISLIATVFLVGEAIALLAHKSGFLVQIRAVSPWWDAGLAAVAVYAVFSFAALPSGLWIKPKRELSLIYLANMAIHGQLRDNPLVQLLITVIGGLIVAVLVKILRLL